MKTSKLSGILVGAGLAVLVGCNGSGGDDVQSSTGAATSGASAAQKQVDDACFDDYVQAAGSCNKSTGDDDVAFTACLTPVKATLVACCKQGGSSSCAADAAPGPTAANDDTSTLASCSGPSDGACISPIVMRTLAKSDLKVTGFDYGQDTPAPTLTPAIDVVNNWLAKTNNPSMDIVITPLAATKWHVVINLSAGAEESNGGPAGGSGEGDAEADHLEFTIDGAQIVEHQINDQLAG